MSTDVIDEKAKDADRLYRVFNLPHTTRVRIGVGDGKGGTEFMILPYGVISMMGPGNLVTYRIKDPSTTVGDGDFDMVSNVPEITKKQLELVIKNSHCVGKFHFQIAGFLDPRKTLKENKFPPELIEWLGSQSFEQLEQLVGDAVKDPKTGDVIKPPGIAVILQMVRLVRVCNHWIRYLCNLGEQTIIHYSGWDLTDMDTAKANAQCMIKEYSKYMSNNYPKCRAGIS